MNAATGAGRAWIGEHDGQVQMELGNKADPPSRPVPAKALQEEPTPAAKLSLR